MSLFDQVNLAEISHPDYPGERLVACRNPALATERARKRLALLEATDTELAKIVAAVDAGRLADAGMRWRSSPNWSFNAGAVSAANAFDQRQTRLRRPRPAAHEYAARTTWSLEKLSAASALSSLPRMRLLLMTSSAAGMATSAFVTGS